MLNGQPIKFEGPRGSLQLSIDSYQFPHIVDDEWDSNWLNVLGEVALDGRAWTFKDPCLTTFEAERLAGWLDEVVTGTAERDFCGFTEPNIDFKLKPERCVRIGFSSESAPPWAEPNSEFGEYGFDVPIDERLRVAAINIRGALSIFPVRGRRP